MAVDTNYGTTRIETPTATRMLGQLNASTIGLSRDFKQKFWIPSFEEGQLKSSLDDYLNSQYINGLPNPFYAPYKNGTLSLNKDQLIQSLFEHQGRQQGKAQVVAQKSIYEDDIPQNTEEEKSNTIGATVGATMSQGVNSAFNTITNNLVKGNTIYDGLQQDAAQTVGGVVSGVAGNLVGQGINSLGGDSMLSRGIGQGVATGIGTIGGQAITNLLNGKKAFSGISNSIKAIKDYKALSSAAKATGEGVELGKLANAGKWNLVGIGGQIVGSGLQAAFGPSKEYEGKYGNVTQTMDTVYDLAQAGVGMLGPVGMGVSGLMAVNKGLSNVFGSTSGMTVQDAILGSAFMPAPLKWMNVLSGHTTSKFKNQSWQNQEKANIFMQNGFGDLGDKFDKARKESGKTYGGGVFGLFNSNDAYKKAQANIDFSNNAWNTVLAMADQNELQNIRSQVMSSINNQRYAQMIQGGFSPLAVGKQGMKIFNNATNHNIGMRLLSAAALIDNKAMILSARGGIKVRSPRMRAHRKGDESRGLTQEEQTQLEVYDAERAEAANKAHEARVASNIAAVEKFNQQANTVMEAMNQQANETPFTGQEYKQATEEQRQEKLEKFHEAEKIGEATLMADLAISSAPLLQRGFRWAFNKAGQLVKVPVQKTIQLKSGITKSVQDNGKIRLSLPSHTDNKPRQFVLEPARDAGDNKYYVHMRMWDDIENKIPASNVTNEEKQQLFDALYDELPEGAEILFPKSGPGFYGTRGTVAGLKHLERDSRFTPGTKGTLQYLDKDGTVKTYEGTSFIKTPQITAENAASITPEQWTAAQDAAIAKGDMVEAQRLADLHASIKGYNSNMPVYNGSPENNSFTVFDTSFRPTKWEGDYTMGAWFGEGNNDVLLEFAGRKPENLRKFYLKMENPYIRDVKGRRWNNLPISSMSDEEINQAIAEAKAKYPDYIVKDLEKNYYSATTDNYALKLANDDTDGVILKNVYENYSYPESGGFPINDYVIKRPSQAKLADAVTYDDLGRRIGLGERHNFDINDNRYGWLPWFLGGSTATTLYNTNK